MDPQSIDRPEPPADPGLTGTELPKAPGYDTASSAEVVRRSERARKAAEKRRKHLLIEKAQRLHRDGFVAGLWHAAGAGDERAAPRLREHFARCVEASLANEAIAQYLKGGSPGWSERGLKISPVVRVEFSHAFILGRVGESLAAARSKAWGEFISIQPLDPRDPVDNLRLVFAFKKSCPYQVRFEQRTRLRHMLGEFAPLVLRALRSSKTEFLAQLTEHEGARIRARTGLGPARFWRAAKGREQVKLRAPERQLTFFDLE